jgi:hypothetical protein
MKRFLALLVAIFFVFAFTGITLVFAKETSDHRCEATTKDGDQCKRFTEKGEKYCFQHKKMKEEGKLDADKKHHKKGKKIEKDDAPDKDVKVKEDKKDKKDKKKEKKDKKKKKKVKKEEEAA